VLYIGDLEPWKGIGSLIKWLGLKDTWDGIEVKFLFVGQGSLHPQLLELSQKLKRYENGTSIEVLGPRKHQEIPSFLQKADALILPSYWEGMPTVVLEAMSSGVPVVSTRVGDIPTTIRDGESGILIDRNHQSFCSALQRLLTNKKLSTRICRNARELVLKQFSLDKLMNRAANLYAALRI
jgi:glycosyltransferase involved in cell wall biosynthesis